MSSIEAPQRQTDVPVSNQTILRPSIGPEEGIRVRDFLLFLWRNRWIAIVAAILVGGAAAAASWLMPPRYAATVVLLPVSDQSGGLSSLASQYSGLSSLAGISLGKMDPEQTAALATLQSQTLTDQYIQQQHLLPILFPHYWNPATRTWRTDNPKDIPTLWKANQLFEKIRAIDQDPVSGLVRLTITWTDPRLAAEWANGLVKLTNDRLKQRAIDEAQRSIAYLDQEVSQSKAIDVKNSIYDMIDMEIKAQTVARAREDYALRVIDLALPPERPKFPKPLLWSAAGALAGILFGLLGAVLRETVTDKRYGEIDHFPRQTRFGNDDPHVSSPTAERG